LKEINLDATAKSLHDTAVEKGFWEPNNEETHIIFYLKQIAMIHSEATEVLEAIRKEQGGYKIVEELADILIRVLDLYQGLREDGMVSQGYDIVSLHDVFEQKAKINEVRDRLHGVLA
jgi:NTP pyrophosphatase (non-canonical NTP hydrolase)